MSLIGLFEPSFITAEQQVMEDFTKSAGTGNNEDDRHIDAPASSVLCAKRDNNVQFRQGHVQVYFPILDEQHVLCGRTELGRDV